MGGETLPVNGMQWTCAYYQKGKRPRKFLKESKLTPVGERDLQNGTLNDRIEWTLENGQRWSMF